VTATMVMMTGIPVDNAVAVQLDLVITRMIYNPSANQKYLLACFLHHELCFIITVCSASQSRALRAHHSAKPELFDHAIARSFISTAYLIIAGFISFSPM
jgi:hypothetical protein